MNPNRSRVCIVRAQSLIRGKRFHRTLVVPPSSGTVEARPAPGTENGIAVHVDAPVGRPWKSMDGSAQMRRKDEAAATPDAEMRMGATPPSFDAFYGLFYSHDVPDNANAANVVAGSATSAVF